VELRWRTSTRQICGQTFIGSGLLGIIASMQAVHLHVRSLSRAGAAPVDKRAEEGVLCLDRSMRSWSDIVTNGKRRARSRDGLLPLIGTITAVTRRPPSGTVFYEGQRCMSRMEAQPGLHDAESTFDRLRGKPEGTFASV